MRTTREPIRTEALLVRRVVYGEADLIVSLFTRERGLMDAVARSARRSSKRFSCLEPMHLLHVVLDRRPTSNLCALADATIVRPRIRLTLDLARLEAAGQALRWIRRAAPPDTPEPALWEVVNDLLDALDDPSGSVLPGVELAAAGLRLLAAVGWGLDLGRCVSCGRLCAASATACIDPAKGGLVCRECGGAPGRLRSDLRLRLIAAVEGDSRALREQDVRFAVDLVEATLTAHAGAPSQG